ncbi:hypothetical protein [Amycolatopsis australiensis]|uniref:Uncharacterized protein n=1 Tax=Amycolatopsis australiensis TaxID=546364 RepID=A0A1K1SNC8_9PSEU|nr:hypothetical protein [Amycolatopsis australiensis]SFW85817.1 hypothetical protein SAMN04489730_6227 [Amycolatopsis australiensis]
MLTGWHSWVATFTGVAAGAVLLLPLSALVTWALAHRRQVRGVPPGRAWRRSLAEVGLVHGTLPGVWLTLLPGSRAGEVPGRVSLVPLRDLATMPVAQIAGNLLIFAALGALAPLRFAALASVPRILALPAGCSALIGGERELRPRAEDVAVRVDGAGWQREVRLGRPGVPVQPPGRHRPCPSRRASSRG